MAYFLGKGTTGLDPSIRNGLLQKISSGPTLFGGQAKAPAGVAPAPAATPGINQGNNPPEGCQNGNPKSKYAPCATGQVIRLDADGREWCCDKAAISGACTYDGECGPDEKCVSKATGQPCNGTCADGQCVGGGQGADCRSCGPDGDCVDGICVGGSAAGRVCVTCQDGYYCAADGKCKKVGGGDRGCQTNEDCGPGQRCVNGNCVGEVPGGGQDCVDARDCATYCQGKPGVCSDGKCTCTGDVEKPDIPGGDLGKCPEGKGEKTYSGCECGREYTTMTGKCPEGYVHVPRSGTGWHGWKKGAVGRCECIKYCEENGYGSDCQGGGTVGEYKYPPEMDALMKLMMARANALLQMPGGYTEAEKNKMFGKGFENIRAQQSATRESTQEALSRAGMLGTGTATGTMAGLASEGEGNITDLMRDIFIGDIGQKRQDLKDYTGLASGLFGQGMNYEQLMEAINAARRGEKNTALMLLLQLLGLYKG